jgi:modulator of FtsH protease HflK
VASENTNKPGAGARAGRMVKRTFGFFVGVGVLGLAGIVLLVLVFQNQFWVKIESYERGVRFNLGKVEKEPLTPDLYLRLPYPFQHIEIVNAETERLVQLGFEMKGTEKIHLEQDALILTKNGNIVDLEAVVNYTISDIVDYVLYVEDQEETVRDASEAVIKSVVGKYSINDILTDKKSGITRQAHEELQELLNSYKLGIKITRVQFVRILNPLKVRDAFESVESAKQDSAIAVEQAEGYRNKVVPEARGKVAQLMREAEGYALERVAKAEGDVELFNQLYEKYRVSKRVTRKRLYLETMEEILPGKKKVLVDEKGSTVNLLNLGGSK